MCQNRFEITVIEICDKWPFKCGLTQAKDNGMLQREVLGKFLQDSFIEMHNLSSFEPKTTSSQPIDRVHSILSLVLQKSKDDLLKLLNQDFKQDDFIRIHPFDIILYFIQRSPDNYKKIVFDALLTMEFSLPLAISDHIYPENFKQYQINRNETMKLHHLN